jgi:hypothetical protein
MNSTIGSVVRALVIGSAVWLAATRPALAGDLRPLDLPSQRAYQGSAAQSAVDPRVYEEFAQHVRGMSEQQRNDTTATYKARLGTAVQQGTAEEIRYYNKLLDILQRTPSK